jgi:hypothetical protein
MELSAEQSHHVEAPSAWFYPNHVAKVVVFGLIGGFPYLAYWGYRSWRAYADNWGYSRAPFWRGVREASGYRLSPLLRGFFIGCYAVCLFPAVDRECRARGLRGVRAAELLAWGFMLLWQIHALSQGWVPLSLFSPVWAVVPVQLAMNRLHRAEGRDLPFAASGWEIVWVLIGALMTIKK